MDLKIVENNKRLYKRLVMSYWDLSKTLNFIDIILTKNLIDSNEKEDITIYTALSIAIIVTYWKPFSENKNRDDVKPILPEKSIKNFDEIELKLHERIRKVRNIDFAHSDPESQDLDVLVKEFNNNNVFIPMGRNPYIPMEEIDIMNLKNMINKVLIWISNEKERIQSIIEINTDF